MATLAADVLFEVVEPAEDDVGRLGKPVAALGDPVAQLLLVDAQQPTAGVLDQDDLLGTQRPPRLMMSDRTTSSVTSPPALRRMCASPVRRPSASLTSSRASMQATTTSLDDGAADSAERSKAAA